MVIHLGNVTQLDGSMQKLGHDWSWQDGVHRLCDHRQQKSL